MGRNIYIPDKVVGETLQTLGTKLAQGYGNQAPDDDDLVAITDADNKNILAQMTWGDLKTFLLSEISATPIAHDLAGAFHTAAGLTAGHFLKATGAAAFAFAAHGLGYADVGAEPANANIQSHIGSSSNPHSVTYTQVGAEPANANIQTHIGTTSGNPHSVSKSDVGLGSVENTALSTWTGTTNITTVGDLGQPLDIKASSDCNATLGSELLTNGEFTSDLSSWTAGANWSWSSGAAAHASGSVETLSQDVSTVDGTVYLVTVEIGTPAAAGSLEITLANAVGGGITITTHSTTRYWAFLSENTGTNALTFTPTTSWDGTLASVSVKAVTPPTAASLRLLTSSGAASTCGYFVTGDDAQYNLGIGSSSTMNCIGLASLESSIAIGLGAMENTASSIANLAIGSNAMRDTPFASESIAIGYSALRYAERVRTIVAIGPYTGRDAGYTYASVLIGYMAGLNTSLGGSTGYNNVFIGYQAGYYQQDWSNVFVGYQAGFGASGSTARTCTGVGLNALRSLTSGTYNTSVGGDSLYSITSGDSNVALGYQAGRYIAGGSTANTTATKGIYIGRGTYASADGVANEIVIGYAATGQGANTIMLGNSSVTGFYCYDTSISSPSDRRIKTNIEALDSKTMLDFINDLDPITFNKVNPVDWAEAIRPCEYKDRLVVENETDEDGKAYQVTKLIKADPRPVDRTERLVGLVAQDVEAAMRRHGISYYLVPQAANGLKSIRYTDLLPALIGAVKELTRRLEAMEGRANG